MRKQPREVYDQAYQLRVVLRGIDPPIWRSFWIKGDKTLEELHRALQIIMGWQDYHLYTFTINGRVFGGPGVDPDLADTVILDSTANLNLSQVLSGEHLTFEYVYDFGDNWEHEITIERMVPISGVTNHPVCIAGARACPPEDCGGLLGYEELLGTISDPEDEEYETTMIWLGGAFDPEGFDINGVNRCLRGLAINFL